MMTGDIGGRLREARQARGLSLHDLASRTKLPAFVLEAIERNDFTRLPGGMFRKAYLRIVAAEVGLDPAQIGEEYAASHDVSLAPVEVAVREDALIPQLSSPPQRSVVALAVMVALAVGWFMLRSVIVPATTGESRENHAVRTMLRSTPIAVANAALELPTPTMVAAIPSAPVHIELAATGRCWVTADVDGDRVMYRLMEPGERVRLEAQRLISVLVGNAGGVQLSINGGAGRVMGREGAVVELRVTPEGVEGDESGAAETASAS